MSERVPDYAQGFKDGFAAGLEEGKKLAPKQTKLDDYVFGQHCSVCGKDFGNKIWGYVCSNANCPTRATAYSGGAVTGAVGSVSSYDNTMAAGANVPYELGN
jgi:hypothetical protein